MNVALGYVVGLCWASLSVYIAMRLFDEPLLVMLSGTALMVGPALWLEKRT